MAGACRCSSHTKTGAGRNSSGRESSRHSFDFWCFCGVGMLGTSLQNLQGNYGVKVKEIQPRDRSYLELHSSWRL